MAEPQKETWIQWVALTTTLLAVCAAISSLKASGYSTRVQVFTTKEANQWAYYQAKNLRENQYRVNREVLISLKFLEPKNAKAQKHLAAKIKDFEAEVARYHQEKNQIRKEAEDLIKQQQTFQRKNGDFALAVMVFQIAITCSAVGALIKKKLLWFVGLALGVWGLVHMVQGFL